MFRKLFIYFKLKVRLERCVSIIARFVAMSCYNCLVLSRLGLKTFGRGFFEGLNFVSRADIKSGPP